MELTLEQEQAYLPFNDTKEQDLSPEVSLSERVALLEQIPNKIYGIQHCLDAIEFKAMYLYENVHAIKRFLDVVSTFSQEVWNQVDAGNKARFAVLFEVSPTQEEYDMHFKAKMLN